MKSYNLLSVLLFVIYFARNSLSLWVDKDGGYRDLLIAVDSPKKLDNCEDFLRNIKKLTTQFSKQLWASTEGRLYFESVDVVLDGNIAKKCEISTIGTNQKWTNADIRLVEGVSNTRSTLSWSEDAGLIRVQQPLGCEQPADVIEIDMGLLNAFGGIPPPKTGNKNPQNLEKEDDVLKEIGKELVTSWARYRWGVFGGLNFPSVREASGSLSNHEERKETYINNQTSCANTTSGCQDKINESSSRNNSIIGVSNEKKFDPISEQQNLVCGKSVWNIIEQHPDLIGKQKNTPVFEQKSSTSKKISTTLNPTSTSSIEYTEYSETTAGTVPTSSVAETEPLSKEKPKLVVRKSRGIKTLEIKENVEVNSKISTFIGTLPPLDKEKVETTKKADEISIEPFLGSLFGRIYNSDSTSEHPASKEIFDKKSTVLSVTLGSSTTTTPSTSTNRSMVVKNNVAKKGEVLSVSFVNRPSVPKRLQGFHTPKINFFTSSKKTIVIALDLSSPAVAQVSVDWLRGGLLRWMFGIGDNLNIGIIASYSNTSFPLSFGPIALGPSTARQLEDHMTLLPYQHEVDDDVYGGHYCLECVIKETEKMLTDAAIPLEEGVLILSVCEPFIQERQINMALNARIPIHTLTLCPNAPLTIERLAVKQGSWSLSQTAMEAGFAAEVQLGELATKITEESLLWPKNTRLHSIHEEEKLLKEENVERIGAYRRVKGRITLPEGDSQRLIVLASSTPAKVVDLWVGNKKKELIRDTTRRYWALLNGDDNHLSYSFKYLSTSLEMPLTVAVGVYERSSEKGLNIKLKTNTRQYQPMNPASPFLKVWAVVTNNGIPVQNAHVILSVTYTGGRTPSTYSLMMLDDGSTEPDMTSGDGIYSRYLSWTPGPGRYILTAKASVSSSQIKKLSDESSQNTIGSSTISLIVESAINGDIFPPSRITSLAVEPLGNTLVNISWLAPGGDLDQGSAWRYQLKMYTGSDALSEENFDSSGIDVYCIHGEEQAPTPAPALFGTPQYCVTSIPFSNLNWYFAIRATDGANNTGRVSNIVSTFIYEPTTTLSTNDADFNNGIQKVMMSTVVPSNNKLSDVESDSWRLYGAALVGAVGFIMLAIALFACIVCCRRARLRASKDPERPIYKIYVNNAYIQEEDGEIKVVSKEKSLIEKDPTQQWVNSLDKYSSVDAPKTDHIDSSEETIDPPRSPSSKFPKPIRFGVLTNGSIMRELPICSSSGSKPSDEISGDDFKYKDLSETISNSTSDGATASTSSGATEITTAEQIHPVKEGLRVTFKDIPTQPCAFEVAYPPLGIPTLPGPTIIPIQSNISDYHSDDEGGFRPRSIYNDKSQPPPRFSSFRYLPPTEEINQYYQRNVDYPLTFGPVSKAPNIALPHGTVRSVKKRRHISFV